MKKRKFTTVLACFMALIASAQNVPANLDLKEDSTDVTTVEDIIAMQQKATTLNVTEKHYANVWGRRSYFNVAFNMSTLSPKEDVNTGMPAPGDKVEDFSSDYGLSIQYGRNYRLHKKPIASMLQFYVDYTGIDLGLLHYKTEKNKNGKAYDSSNTIKPNTSDSYYYTPWNLEKYEVNYGMNIGPSMTIAPFITTGSQELHFLKLNLYYHIGYHASVLLFKGDEKYDANTDEKSEGYETMKDNTKIEWGHGLTNSFGLSLSWKNVGIGYEHRIANEEYKSLNTGDFGKDKYKFKTSTSRIFIQFRM